jgi:class 3 adenylate cyclase
VDGLAIAYQEIGAGPPDIVFVPDWYNHVEAQWEDPINEAFLRGLASLGRLIVFDKRGTGLSDPVALSQLPTVEAWAEDLAGVLDAVGSTSVVLVCASGGAALGLPFAATAPQRVAGLVLIDATACVPRRDDYPAGAPEDVLDFARRWARESWGTGETTRVLAPSRSTDPAFREWRGRYERLAASPGTLRAMTEKVLLDIDVRAVLPSVRAPTLVLHRAGDRWVFPEHGRYLAAHIEDARYVELPGADHLWLGVDYDDLLSEVTEFVTGVRPPPQPERILSTVVVTDIVTSTKHAVSLGDRQWRSVLDRHDQLVDHQLERLRGRRIKHTGDGVVAAFDGPARAIKCASSLIEALRPLGLEIRVGVHTGECEIRGEDLSGLTVHIAARIAALASAGEVLVSRTVRDLVVGSQIAFADYGEVELAGVPDSWTLLRVAGLTSGQ